MHCTQYSVQSYAIYLVVYHFELYKGKQFSSTSAGSIHTGPQANTCPCGRVIPFRADNIVMFHFWSRQVIKLKRKRAAEKMRQYRAHRANTDPTFRLKEAEKKRSQRKRDKGTISCEKLEEMRRLNRIRQIRCREKRRSDRASAGSSAEHKPDMKTRPGRDKQIRWVCKVKQETS